MSSRRNGGRATRERVTKTFATVSVTTSNVVDNSGNTVVDNSGNTVVTN